MIIIEHIANSTADTNLNLRNFYDRGGVERLIGPPRYEGKVTEIVVHETVTRDVATTIKVLKRRKLGAHFIIDPEGAVTQHGDLVHDALSHAGSHNKRSVGIEVINPYYPRYLKSGPWTKVIDAHWAHQKRYVVPPVCQLEALYQLLAFLTQTKTERFDVPWAPIGLGVAKKRFAMGRVWGSKWGKKPGIYAHTAFGHADGSFPLLYCIFREAMPIWDSVYAWQDCMDRASRCGWYADLRDVL